MDGCGCESSIVCIIADGPRNSARTNAGLFRHDAGVLDDFLAARFRIAWDSTEHIAPLARACLRNKPLRKVVTAIIGKSFLPRGEASFLRYVYDCRKPAA